MAITYYTGIPRSGKTLKAVALIYETFVAPNIEKTGFLDKALEKVGFSTEKESEYINCYTNINQFNFDIDERLLKLDFQELEKKLNLLHLMYLAKNSDDELIEKAKELNICHSLFVIDEAHNFFNKKSDLLTWWLSYHGHIYHEIILITQHLTLILKEYTQFTEYFYRAVPQRFRFSKNTFKYIEYSGRELYKNQRLGTVSLKIKPEYFNLYVSGAKKNDKPVIYKYIFILLFMLLITAIAIYRFNSSLEETKKQTLGDTSPVLETSNNISQQNTNNLSLQNEVIKEPLPVLKLFKFVCFEKFCYYKNINKTLEIPVKILTNFLKGIDEDKKFIEIFNNSNKINIYVLDDEEKYSFLLGAVKEKKQDSQMNLLK